MTDEPIVVREMREVAARLDDDPSTEALASRLRRWADDVVAQLRSEQAETMAFHSELHEKSFNESVALLKRAEVAEAQRDQLRWYAVHKTGCLAGQVRYVPSSAGNYEPDKPAGACSCGLSALLEPAP